MNPDPRHRNELFDSSSVKSYIADYAESLRSALLSIDSDAVDAARAALLGATDRGNRIYVIGNGGSAAIADHLCCDWTKGTNAEGHRAIKTHSLSSNVALYSAIANDYGFEKVFTTQVDFFCEPGDVLIAISSSGNSPNIVQAVEFAKANGVTVVGLSGFTGGRLAAISDISIHVDVANYGIVEDVHQAVMHVIAQFIAIQRDKTKS